MFSICSVVSLSILNDAFVFSAGRQLLSFVQSTVLDGPDASIMAAAFIGRGTLNGNEDRLSTVLARIEKERGELDSETA